MNQRNPANLRDPIIILHSLNLAFTRILLGRKAFAVS
jgi:hypothetical protein